MCGLVYMHDTRKKPVSGKLIKRYTKQRNRGTEGFGVYRPLTDQMAHNTKEKKMLQHMRKLQDPILLFHHRRPTSPMANVRNACHPFSTKDFFDSEYILVHNGGISNKQAMFDKHKKLGINYVSLQPDGKGFCDSESLLWELALYLEGKQDSIEAYGGIAFILYKKDGKHASPKLYFGRNSNPLKMNQGKNRLTLASEGEGNDIDSNTLYCYDYVIEKLTTTKLEIPHYISQTGTPSYSNPTPYRSSQGSASSSFPSPHTANGPVNSGFRGNSAYTPGSVAAQASGHTAATTQSASTGSNSGSGTTPSASGTHEVKPAPTLVSRIPTPAEKAEKAMAELIKTKVHEYLKDNEGLYAGAMYDVDQDMEDLAEISGDSCDDVQILKAVYEMLEMDPFNINQDAIHPNYVADNFPVLKHIGFTTTNE